MDALLKDAAYALRALRRNAGFTTVAILTIGIGIGACTAIFSVVNAVLLRPLPYADPARLTLLWTELRARNVLDFPFPIPDLGDLRRVASSFEGLAGITNPSRSTFVGDGVDPENVQAAGATPNLFTVLGARIEHGRNFADEDGLPIAQRQEGVQSPPPPQPAIAMILSHEFWQRRYGGDTSVIGRTIEIDGGRGAIVGVLAPGFALLFPPRARIFATPDVWVALRLNYDTASRRLGVLRVVGRLKPGVTLAAAQAELNAIAADWKERYPFRKDADMRARVVPMRDDLVREVRPQILALFGAVVFVLLIACANVANLLVVRAASRHRELAIRGAIGGSPWRLMRQLMVEALLLSGGGMLLGLLIALNGIDLLKALAPARLPRIDGIGVDATAILFAAAAAFGSSVAFGLVPAWRASKPDLMDVLRSTSSAPGLRAGRRLRDAVVVLEVGLSFVLLIGSGLMLRSFLAAQRIDPGFDAQGVLTFNYPAGGRSPEDRAARSRLIRDRLAAISGVKDVSASNGLPLDGLPGNVPYGPEAALSDPKALHQANSFFVLPGYFSTLRTRIIEGRTFTDADNRDGNRDVVIDDRAAAIAFPNRSAVGQTLVTRVLFGQEPQRHTIIGVVAHQRHETVVSEGPEGVFFVDGAMGFGSAQRWLVRTDGPAASLAPTIRAALAEVDSRLPAPTIQVMTTFVDRAMAPLRFAATLIGVFAAIAALLAAVGLYGVLSTLVRQRTAEIGLRIVLGADPRGVFRMIVSEGLRMSAIGVVLGVVVALAMTRVTSGLLVGVPPTDPMTYVLVTLTFFSIVLAAGWLPARRAARLDPSIALREE